MDDYNKEYLWEGWWDFVGEPSRRIGNSVWGNIIKIGKDLERVGVHFMGSFGKEVGDGSCMKFWEEFWVGGERLKDWFGRLYQLELNKEALVAERGGFEGDEWCWRWE